MKTRVNVEYLEFAHRPAADDGYKPALQVLKGIEDCNKMKTLDLSDPVVLSELESAASLWAWAGEDYPAHARTARRLLNKCRRAAQGPLR